MSEFLVQRNYVPNKWHRSDSNPEPPYHESRAIPLDQHTSRVNVVQYLKVKSCAEIGPVCAYACLGYSNKPVCPVSLVTTNNRGDRY